MNKELMDNIEKINKIPIRSIIEGFGGTFINHKNFSHPHFDYEKSPSGFIYSKNGKELYKHFKSGSGGDSIDFIQEIYGCNKIEAVKLILNKSSTYEYKTVFSVEKLKIEEANNVKKNKYKMNLIIKNSELAVKNKIAMEYFKRRKIDEVITNFKDLYIKILINSYMSKMNNEIYNIVYYFFNNKNQKNNFMILKGINKFGEKNGKKLNVMTCRPIIHKENENEKFIICEGIEDAFSAIKMKEYSNFISLNSTSCINKLMASMISSFNWFEKNEFEVCFDNDETGEKSLKKIKIFSNLVSMDKYNDFKNFIEDIKCISEDKKYKEKAIYAIGLINESKEIKSYEHLMNIMKILSDILPNDYFNDYGKVYNIKESKYYSLLKQLKKNDLNEMLVDRGEN